MRIPASTYRIQLKSPSTSAQDGPVGFARIEQELPRLAELGIGALHLSPVFTASEASRCGYDLVDPTEVSAALGGVEGLRSLRIAAKLHGIGMILDLVPDRLFVAVPQENRWWWDVLTYGTASRYHTCFDLEASSAGDGIPVPALNHPSDVDSLEFDEWEGSPVLRCGSQIYPIAPGTGEGPPHKVYSRQSYRLVPRSDATFPISADGTVSVRQEDPRVFELAHRGLSKLVREGLVDGVCIDTLDGLADPVGYTRSLRDLLGADRWIVVDKTLSSGETLDSHLDVEGTSGSDFLAPLTHLFLDSAGEPPLSRLAAEFIGEVPTTEQVALDLLGSELRPQVWRLAGIVAAETYSEPTTSSLESLSSAIARVVAATGHHRADYPVLAAELPWVFAGLTETAPELDAELEALAVAMSRRQDIATRVARLTAAAAKRAATDHRHSRSVHLHVLDAPGADPESWALPVAAFHLRMRSRGVIAPYSVSAANPTWQGQRAWARLLAATQYPERWAKLVDTLRGKNPPPARDLGYVLLQHIVGHWPTRGLASLTPGEREELRGIIDSLAAHVAAPTLRNRQRAADESSVADWIDAWFDKHAERIDDFVASIAEAESAISHAARAIQILAPGVPEVTAEVAFGTEESPDAGVAAGTGGLTEDDGGVALLPETALIRCALELRRRMPEVFTDGDYSPLTVSGPARGKVLAFARSLRTHDAIPPAPQVLVLARLRTRDAESWLPGTEVVLPDGEWRIEHGLAMSPAHVTATSENADATFTGRIDASTLANHPVIVLVRT